MFEKPGANELFADLQWGLLQRFTARSIKFVLGLQQQGQQAEQGAAAGGGGAAAVPRLR